MASIYGRRTPPTKMPHFQGHTGPADDFPELTAELMEDKLRGGHNMPNTSKPLRDNPGRDWKRIDYVAPPRVYASQREPQEPDYTVTVLDAKKREEHRFKVHRYLLNAQSKYFEAAQKPVFAEGKFNELTLSLEEPMTVHAIIEYCYTKQYMEDTVEKVQESKEKPDPKLLYFHMDVCALASKWFIEPLRHLSFSYFTQVYSKCRSWSMDDEWDADWGSCLRDAIILAYERVPVCDQQLHFKLATIVATDIPRLLGNQGLVFAWDKVFSEAPEFCGALLRALRFGQGIPPTEIQVVCRACSRKQMFIVRFTKQHHPPRFCPWCGTDSLQLPASNLIARTSNLDAEQWKILVHDKNSPWAGLFPHLSHEEEEFYRTYHN